MLRLGFSGGDRELGSFGEEVKEKMNWNSLSRLLA